MKLDDVWGASRTSTVSTPSRGFPYSWKPEPPFKITWSLDIFDALYVDRLMRCVLSLCMWSVFGLCAVRHRIGHRWRWRVPSWRGGKRKKKNYSVYRSWFVCMYVWMCVQTWDEMWQMSAESWIYCCRLFSGMTDRTSRSLMWPVLPSVTVISRAGKFKRTL